MNIQLEREKIVKHFKRNNHYLNTTTLGIVIQYVQECQGNRQPLGELVQKINEMTIKQNIKLNQKILKRAIDLLKHKDGKYKTYYQLIQEMFAWSIFYLSPYQSDKNKLFNEKPDKYLFNFQPQDKIDMYLKRFKKIRDFNKQFYHGIGTFIGILYEKQSRKNYGKSQLYLQDQISQIKIQFSNNYQINCFLISGCIYIARGQYRQMVLTVHEIIIPKPVPQRNTLLFQKFNSMCDMININKNSLQFDGKDFLKFDAIYNDQHQVNKPLLIFGGITMNQSSMSRIYKIVSSFSRGTECIIIMLSDQKHQQVNVSTWLSNHKVYIIPHINSQGPRILPKIPVLKNNYECKILPNPIKFSIHGKQIVFVNYPLVKNLYSKTLISKQINKINQQEMVTKISDFLFSQGNIAISNQIFWKQSQYMDISAENLLIICDKACPMLTRKNQSGGGIVTTGNFNRDGDFITYFPKIKDGIQFCQQPNDM